MFKKSFIVFTVLFFAVSIAGAQSKKVLFDNTKTETAGNADWIIDTDQPIPSPAQSGITPSTPETYWLGAISAWGVDLVKLGYTVHTLTTANGITYGNGGNPYDLSNYDLFVVCEPQDTFSASEKQAILNFVRNGGGLCMVADHDNSDRNSNGWDSPEVWNDVGIDTAFGFHFQSTGETNNNITQNTTNVATGTDSMITGIAGTASILSYHNGTTMRLTGSNASAAGHVWMTGVAHGSSQIMLATARYGNGRVGAVGDSSPADDSTGQPSNNLFNGWTGDAATDNIFFLNMSVWLATRVAVTPPPPQVVLEVPADFMIHIPIPTTFRWRTAASATNYRIDVSTSNTFSSMVFSDSTITDTTQIVSTLDMGIQYYWRVRAKNDGGWGPYSATRTFLTWDVPPPIMLLDPANNATNVPLPPLLRWRRYPVGEADPGKSRIVTPMNPPQGYIFQIDVSTASDFSNIVFVDTNYVDTLKNVDGLELGRTYYWRVRAKNPAGWGAYSDVRSFTTWDVPSPVVLVSPADGATMHVNPVPLMWRTEVSASSYHFELSTTNVFDTPLLSDSSLTDTTFSASGLDTGVTYYWHVRAKNLVGWGDFSTVRTFRRTLEQTVVANMIGGWNLISLPVMVSDASRMTLFSSAATSAFLFDGSTYVPKDTLAVGIGYWLRFANPDTVSITGIPFSDDTLDVIEGWNLVGSLATPVAVTSITSLPPGIIESPFFGYQTTYASVDTLQPMQGYWVKVSQAGKIILQ